MQWINFQRLNDPRACLRMLCFNLVPWLVSLLALLRGFHAFSCDEKCADKPVFTPSRLVVKFGEPTSATCFVCQHACSHEPSLGNPARADTKKGITTLWKFDEVTEWDTSPVCHYTGDDGRPCCRILPVTVYQPPKEVQLSALPKSGDHRQYTLECKVQEVAPVAKLNVTFYRGARRLQSRRSEITSKTPVNETFTLDIDFGKDADEGLYWCEALLMLGAEGPQEPPVVRSEKITVSVNNVKRSNGGSTATHSFSLCFMLLVFAFV